MTSEPTYPDLPKPTIKPRPSEKEKAGGAKYERVQKHLEFLEDERLHYSHVRKKYKRAYKASHNLGAICGAASGALSSGAIATALTGIGVVATPAIAGAASVFGVGSLGCAFLAKRFKSKLEKHTAICTLVSAKQQSLAEICDKVLEDGEVTKEELELVASEVSKYRALKTAIQSKGGDINKTAKESTAKAEKATSTSEQPLDESVRIMRELKDEFEKKLEVLAASRLTLNQ